MATSYLERKQSKKKVPNTFYRVSFYVLPVNDKNPSDKDDPRNNTDNRTVPGDESFETDTERKTSPRGGRKNYHHEEDPFSSISPHYFRGFLLRIFSEYDKNLANYLHETPTELQKKNIESPPDVLSGQKSEGSNLVTNTRIYSLQQDYLYEMDLAKNTEEDFDFLFGKPAIPTEKIYGTADTGENSSERANESKIEEYDRRHNHYRRGKKIGLQYHVNIFNITMTDSLVKSFLSFNKETFQYGREWGIIHKITITHIPFEKFWDHAKPLRFANVHFISPTAFSIMGSNFDMRLPLPEYFFGNLARLWKDYLNHVIEVPDDLWDWIRKHVAVVAHRIKTRAWNVGKKVPFVGFEGFISFEIRDFPDPRKVKDRSKLMGEFLSDVNNFDELDEQTREIVKNLKYARWLDALLLLGYFSNVGKNRTLGCGRYIIKERRYFSF